MASGLGTLGYFEGTSPVGGEWSVQESVVQLDAATARDVAGKLAEPARTGCTALRGRDVALAASEQVLVVSGLTPAGSVGEATVYALAGRIWLTCARACTSPGPRTPPPCPCPARPTGCSRWRARPSNGPPAPGRACRNRTPPPVRRREVRHPEPDGDPGRPGPRGDDRRPGPHPHPGPHPTVRAQPHRGRRDHARRLPHPRRPRPERRVERRHPTGRPRLRLGGPHAPEKLHNPR